METTNIDAVIIGAGHAGLNASRALQRAELEHVVLEKGRIGETWRTQRWNSFKVNTPNWTNGLLDYDYDADEPEDFFDTEGLVTLLERYAEHFSLPVIEGIEVLKVERLDDGSFVVHAGDSAWKTKNLLVCSGSQNVPTIPSVSLELPGHIEQMHAAEYRSPGELAPGAVLVVGAGQTGCQITEELIESGRRTYLCTSKVARAVRRYRGRDLLDWMIETGMAKATVAQLPDPAMQRARQPRISGTRGGHTLSLHELGRSGVTLLGRFRGVEGTRVDIGDDLAENVAFADASSRQIKAMIDGYIAATGTEAPEAQPDPAEEPFAGLDEMAAIRELDLRDERISTVIWATGFSGNFAFFTFDIALDEHGVPRHREGASEVPGLYFLGFPWLRTRTSGILAGTPDDALHICGLITSRE